MSRPSRATVEGAAYWQAHATDSDVAEFMKQVVNPRYVAYLGGGTYTATGLDTLEDAMELLTRLQRAGEDCTCATTPVWRCPNYVEGDERDG